MFLEPLLINLITCGRRLTCVQCKLFPALFPRGALRAVSVVAPQLAAPLLAQWARIIRLSSVFLDRILVRASSMSLAAPEEVTLELLPIQAGAVFASISLSLSLAESYDGRETTPSE